ncbi:NAD(P)/FAD-dependent oxidoreductase [Planctomonas sp. JC2975]|uniref:flavin-containing monooxygenase n=1 Tax=Planctomonas sp. JC2975 TaxID=2729626 RepID=UPI0014741D6E|nr:NAD(P)/FAD-dependent oxidoreductase [Planctomonas sp. JC2975]NNC11500.1 NAD(P)/FAD-dependent oxidoreductase [Planctomonas sp. JC2975]
MSSAEARTGEVVEVDTLIVGAGFAGLGLGIRLRRRNAQEGRDESFLILERAHDVGGTWRDNVYPGVACDIPSHLYSFSFRTSAEWTHVYPSGWELQEYLRQCAREEGLLPHLRFGESVEDARWDEADGHWIVTTTARRRYRAKSLVSAVGRLSEPRLPAAGRLDGFPGAVLHTAGWDADLDLHGARVGLVGTGASAVQVLPHLQRAADHVTVFQRSAPYVVPRGDRAYTEAERAELADPAARERLRDILFWDAEAGFPARMREPAAIAALRERAASHLRRQVKDPALLADLTPDYEIGCKRVLLSDDYYPAVASSNVTLETSALDRIEHGTAVAESGARYDLDVLVFATGFNATRPPFADLVTGRHGIRLSEHWSDGMRAYASTVVHGFPNLFVLDGPNASLGHNSAIYMIETQLDYVLGALDHLAATRMPLDVPQDAEDAYVADIDAAAADSVWLSGCSNWYVDERSGRLTLLWPGYAHTFRDRVGTFDAAVFGVPVAG